VKREEWGSGFDSEFGRIFFTASRKKTGLSACIFFAAGKKGYRFYPLRCWHINEEL
jgi:hypothetical protein